MYGTHGLEASVVDEYLPATQGTHAASCEAVPVTNPAPTGQERTTECAAHVTLASAFALNRPLAQSAHNELSLDAEPSTYRAPALHAVIAFSMHNV